MKIVTRTAAAALLITMPMALGACGSGHSKPSKADVKAGYVKLMNDNATLSKLPTTTKVKVSNCVVDKIYDRVDAKTLVAMKGHDEKYKGSDKDGKTLESASTSCGQSLKKELSAAS
jgi:hypothetical protein